MRAVTTIKRKTFVKGKKFGVSRIVREGYGQASDWYALVKEIRERDGNKCVFCSSAEKLGTHHLTPLSKGGTTTKRNLATVCEKCHERRHKHLR